MVLRGGCGFKGRVWVQGLGVGFRGGVGFKGMVGFKGRGWV